MIQVTLTANLGKYYPDRQFEIEASSVRDILAKMDGKRPNFSSYILEDTGEIRKHVNVFVNGDVIRGIDAIDRNLDPGSKVHIMQALSGG